MRSRFVESYLSWWPKFEFQIRANFFNYGKRYNSLSPLRGSSVPTVPCLPKIKRFQTFPKICQKSNSFKPFPIPKYLKASRQAVISWVDMQCPLQSIFIKTRWDLMVDLGFCIVLSHRFCHHEQANLSWKNDICWLNCQIS